MQNSEDISSLMHVPLEAVGQWVVLLEQQLQQKRTQLRALRDFALLRGRLAEQHALQQDPDFVALLTKVAIYAVGRTPVAVDVCCICTGNWGLLDQLRAADSCYEGGHCAQHAEQFHQRVPERHNCCEPNYHPLRDYAWRVQLPVQTGAVPGQE
jgi:hypothetical protein